MTTPTQVTPLAAEDYEAIESAVMETSRGRWFLAEYARRNRHADTDAIVVTLERIERTIRRDRVVPDVDRIRLDLADMAEAISRTKQEIAQIKHDTSHGGRFADAGHELDAIVDQTETATNEILLAAENVQEVAWTLREAGAGADLCDKLDTHATEIYTACSFQDLTGQRTRKVVTVLRYLESRINAMMAIWGLDDVDDLPVAVSVPPEPDERPDAHLLNGPPLQGRGIDQIDVDDLMWSDAEIAEAEQPSEATAEDRNADEPLDEDPVPDDRETAWASGAAPDVVETVRPSVEEPDVVETMDVDPLFDIAEPVECEVEAEVEAHAEVEADAEVDAEPDIFAPAEPGPRPERPTAIADEFDLSAADVFSSEATDRLASVVRERREPTPADVEEPPPARVAHPSAVVAHGNTLRTVVLEAATEPAPALVVVETGDPIAALTAAERLIAFG